MKMDELQKQIDEKEYKLKELRTMYADAIAKSKTVEAMAIEERGTATRKELELLQRRMKALEYSQGIGVVKDRISEPLTLPFYDNNIVIEEVETKIEIPVVSLPYKDD